MNSRQRRSVRCSAWVMASEFKGRLGFYTVTVPSPEYGVSHEDRRKLNENWGGADGVMKRFHQELQRELSRLGLPNLYLSVAEFQERRWSKYGQLALHQHVLLPVSKAKSFAYDFTSDRLREIWGNVLSGVLGHEVNVAAAVDTKKVDGTAAVAKYLSKYMSKGGKLLQELIQKGMTAQIPTSWWSSSCDLKALVSAATVVREGEIAGWFLDLMPSSKEKGSIKYEPIEIPWTNSDTGEVWLTTIGYTGWFVDRSAYEFMRSLVSDEAFMLTALQDMN